ncbi:leucine-rich repeat protein [Prevotella sp.]|uniref:leucine-rich repeat protein n=1 Tax=Prevotella sp. TaxID=59823 RepID=UPI002ABE4CBD|nr:leucine-rich repeat protein [Prevotella sp.]
MARQKYSPNEIQSKADDWGLDVNDKEQRPFSGMSVQKFIKQTFDGKIGILHYDSSNNRYVAFADAESRDAYLDDPTKTDLLLGTFDAPFNFSASVSLISMQSNVLLKDSKGHYIEYTFDITDKNGASTMESVNVTYTFISGSVKKKVSAQYAYGTKVSMCVDDYLGEGETIIQIAIVGQDTLAATTRSVSYRVLDLTLRSGYNVGTVNDVRENAYVQMPFWVKSSRHVMLKASIDYGEWATVVETDTYETNGAYQIDTLNLADGKHNIRLQAQNIIDGVTYASDTVYKDFIVSRGEIKESLVLMDGIIPMGADDTEFKLYGLKKYIPGTVTLAAYNPNGTESAVSIALVSGGNEMTIGEKVMANGTSESVTFTPLVSGNATLRVKNGETTVEVKADIAASSVQIEGITNQLELSLRAIGRSNNDADKEKWESGTYKTTFSGFEWNARSGWVDNALKINPGAAIDVNIAPLSLNPENNGFTFEMEFSTELVSDENTVVMDLTENGRGIVVTASSISLVSKNGREVSTRFRSGEKHRVAFVIDNSPVRNSKLSYLYVDGVPSGSVDFLSSDTYAVLKQMRIGGTDGCVVNVSDIRIYRRALTAQEIRNNFMMYQTTAEEMLEIYNRNDIMTDGKIDYDKVANHIPVMIVTGDIALLENTTNKKERIIANVQYIDRQHTERSFNMINAVMTPQGTSSMFYPKHNFRLYTLKEDSTELRTGSHVIGEGTLVEDRKYSFKEGAQPVGAWCLKADYAESSSTHNTGVARLWNDALANMQVSVDGTLKYAGRTKAQQAAIDNGYEYDVRTTVDGFPIVMFYHENEEDPLIFMGKYNFNNDKSTESVFGFCNIPGFDDSKVECWEHLDSGNPYGLFTGDPSGFDANWSKAFEARYPDGSDNTAALKKLYTWLYSCKGDQSKFNTEWKRHLDPYKVAAYYVYLVRFGGVDQVVKNAMLMTEDGEIWFFINYDNDTILGLDNDGLVSFGWDITRQTKIAGTDVYCYAGHDSLLWNLLEGCEEFMRIVPEVDQALYSARKGKQDVGLSYDNVIGMFNEEQSEKWCETIYAEDAKYKYIDPFKNNSVNQLAKLQGRRSSHRAWWVRNRWNLMDGKWMTGEFRKDGVTFKCQQGAAGTKLTVTAGNEMYYGIKVQTTVTQSEALKAGVSHDFAIDRDLQIGTPVSVCNASNVAGLDISNFAESLSSLDIQKVKNSLGESRLKKLVIGKAGVTNSFLSAISGIENAYALQELDITGLKQITSLDLSQQTDLQALSASQSGLRDMSLPEGAPIKRLELPEPMQVLKLVDMPELEASGLKLDGNGKGVTSMTITNCPKLSKSADIVMTWLKFKTAEDKDSLLYMDNVDWQNVTPENFLKICAAKQNGMDVTLKGRVKLSTSSQEIVDTITSAFGANVFLPDNELYVNAPDAIYLAGPDSILEGENAQFVAAVFSEHKGTVTYMISSGSRTGTSIDKDSGLLTSVENGNYDSTLTIKAIHKPTQGTPVSVEKQLNIKRRTYPSTVTIEGSAAINQERQTYKMGKYESDGVYYCEWELSGDIINNVEIESQTNTQCMLKRKAESMDLIDGTLKLTVKKKYNNAVAATATMGLSIMKEGVIMTKTTNAPVLEAMFKAGLCASADYMTKEEAERVVSEDLQPGTSSSTSIFYKYQYQITHFEEFEYFKSVTSIAQCAFQNCSSLTSINIPSSVTSIGNKAFQNCSSLTSINIPSGVTDINSLAFYGCSSLTSINIPSSVTSIGYNAFSGCGKLEAIVVAEGNKVYDSRNGCNAIIYTSRNGLIRGCKNTVIPNEVTSINEYAFSGCSSLTSIVIPSSVTSIGNGTFQGCSSLTSINIPSSVTSIGNGTFQGCSSLTGINIPSGVTRIGDRAFYDCSSLTSINIPSGVTDINSYVFSGCSSLTSINIPSSVTYIGYNAFSGCQKLSEIKALATRAPTLESDVFGSSTSYLTGRDTYDKGTNKLYVPAGATGYDQGQWKNVLCNAEKCGFTISYTL